MSNPVEEAFDKWLDNEMAGVHIGDIYVSGETKKLMGMAFAAGVVFVAERNLKAIKEIKS